MLSKSQLTVTLIEKYQEYRLSLLAVKGGNSCFDMKLRMLLREKPHSSADPNRKA